MIVPPTDGVAFHQGRVRRPSSLTHNPRAHAAATRGSCLTDASPRADTTGARRPQAHDARLLPASSDARGSTPEWVHCRKHSIMPAVARGRLLVRNSGGAGCGRLGLGQRCRSACGSGSGGIVARERDALRTLAPTAGRNRRCLLRAAAVQLAGTGARLRGSSRGPAYPARRDAHPWLAATHRPAARCGSFHRGFALRVPAPTLCIDGPPSAASQQFVERAAASFVSLRLCGPTARAWGRLAASSPRLAYPRRATMLRAVSGPRGAAETNGSDGAAVERIRPGPER